MASSDDDSSTGISSDNKLLAQDVNQDTKEEATEVEACQSSRKWSKIQSAGQAIISADPRAIALMKKAISKKLHGHVIDVNLSLYIVAAALELEKG